MARTRGARSGAPVGRGEPSRARRVGKTTQGTDVQDLTTSDHPGPIDPSILYAQETHRSSLIWTGQVDLLNEVRHHRMWELDVRVALYVAAAGFFALSRVHNMQIDWPLITALIERWRSETHTFHFREGEMTITLQDVSLLTGLPIDGRPITGNEQNEDWSAICVELLGRDPDRGRSPFVVHMSWFAREMRTPPDDADEITLQQYARAYILCMLASSLLTDTSGNDVSLHYLPLLRDFTCIRTYSWGSGVLAYLYRQLCSACVGKHKQVGGAGLLLQFWSWERMTIGRPQQLSAPVLDEFDGVGDDMMRPSISYGRWGGTRTYAQTPRQVLIYYRDQLDRQGPGDLVWTPYSEERFEGINPMCLAGRAFWGAEVPMICFAVVEWQYSSRVLRQFGYSPVIPNLPRQGHDELHKVTRRKGKLDWSTEHGKWIDIWNQRQTFVLHGSTDYTTAHYREYSDWYARITRRLIQPPSFQMTSYQPTAPERSNLIKTLIRSCKAASEIFREEASARVKRIAHDLFHSCRSSLNDLNESVILHIDPSEIYLPPETPPSSGRSASDGGHENDQPSQQPEDNEAGIADVDLMGPSQITQATPSQIPHRRSKRSRRSPDPYTPDPR